MPCPISMPMRLRNAHVALSILNLRVKGPQVGLGAYVINGSQTCTPGYVNLLTNAEHTTLFHVPGLKMCSYYNVGQNVHTQTYVIKQMHMKLRKLEIIFVILFEFHFPATCLKISIEYQNTYSQILLLYKV